MNCNLCGERYSSDISWVLFILEVDITQSLDCDKVAELKQVEQDPWNINKFIQMLARRSDYEGWTLIEKFKKGMNSAIRWKLMEAEQSPRSIE